MRRLAVLLLPAAPLCAGDTAIPLYPLMSVLLAGTVVVLAVLLKHKQDLITRYRGNMTELNAQIGHTILDLQEQKDAFETIYRKSSDGILLLQNEQVIDYNDAVVRMLVAEQRTQLLGQTFHALSREVQPDGTASRERAAEMLEACRHHGTYRTEWMLKRFNGTEFMAEMTLTYLFFNHRETVHIVFHDIEERLAMERRAKEQEQLLHHHARNAQMGEMISMIAHQWRQPLNTMAVILQRLELLDRRDKLTSEILAEGVATGTALVQKMSETINDFMNFLKSDTEVRRFALKSVFDNIDTIIGGQFQSRGIALKLSVDPELTLDSYQNEVTHVLIILLANAADAYDTRAEAYPVIEIAVEASAGEIILHVQDFAGGIPEEIIDKIFAPYFTTKPSGKGTGIGLYMSKRIVEGLLHGTIDVQNTQGGALFTLRLPR